MKKLFLIIKRTSSGTEYIIANQHSEAHKETRSHKPKLHGRSEIQIKRYTHGRGHLTFKGTKTHLDLNNRFSYIGL
jgi:hypothetical protein